jgi:hypothetical protein
MGKEKTRQKQAETAYKFQDVLSKNGIYWLREGSYSYKYYPKVNKIVSGGFESPLFWENERLNIRHKLLEELTPVQPVMEKNLDMYKLIKQSESICVHVRRGDFLIAQNADSFSVCSEKYFRDAYKKSQEVINDGKYFIFSDDIKWCRENLNFIHEAVFVQDGIPPYETLRLMYSCKHFIISNSTFSWWGQYLSRNPDKIVISPSKWNNDGFDSPLIDKNKWLFIEV